MEPQMSAPNIVYPARPPQYHGFCWNCCHPAASCCCGRQCRKEAKELVVTQGSKAEAGAAWTSNRMMNLGHYSVEADAAREAAVAAAREASDTTESARMWNARRLAGTGEAFIGGCCCVHLSVEYMPVSTGEGDESRVTVIVEDSEKTGMAWQQRTGPGSVYQVRENIITTKPGAHLVVEVDGMVARVRWCEVFSC